MTTACSSKQTTPKQQHWLEENIPIKVVEKVFRIALAVFALISLPVYFLSTFIFGAVWAAVDPTLTRKTCEKGLSYICSQGFLEQLSGVEIPIPLGLLADFAVKWVHIQHHASIFTPLTGLGIGIWAGVNIRDTLNRAM